MLRDSSGTAGSAPSSPAPAPAVSGLPGTAPPLAGLRQQRNDTRFLTREERRAEVATRPPTLAHSLTRNWRNPSL